jgi:hypothetical protein
MANEQNKCLNCKRSAAMQALDVDLCEDCYKSTQIDPLRSKAVALRKELLILEQQIDAAQRCLRNAKSVQHRLCTCYKCHKTFDTERECEFHEDHTCPLKAPADTGVVMRVKNGGVEVVSESVRHKRERTATQSKPAKSKPVKATVVTSSVLDDSLEL